MRRSMWRAAPLCRAYGSRSEPTFKLSANSDESNPSGSNAPPTQLTRRHTGGLMPTIVTFNRCNLAIATPYVIVARSRPSSTAARRTGSGALS